MEKKNTIVALLLTYLYYAAMVVSIYNLSTI